jgi:hypothetical protein
MNISRQLFIVSIAAAVCACSNTASENVTTEGIRADIDVFSDGAGRTLIDVQLDVGSNGIGSTSLELSPGDTLTVTANGIQKTMIEDASILGEFSYEASYDFDDGGTMFTVSFARNNGINAPNSNVVLPDGFIIQSPTSNDIFGPADSIPIVWSPSGTSVLPTGQVSLSCFLNSAVMITETNVVTIGADTGVANLPVAAVIPVGLLDTSRLCEGEVRLSRWRRGNLDPNYGEGGDITAQQIKSQQFFVDLTL